MINKPGGIDPKLLNRQIAAGQEFVAPAKKVADEAAQQQDSVELTSLKPPSEEVQENRQLEEGIQTGEAGALGKKAVGPKTDQESQDTAEAGDFAREEGALSLKNTPRKREPAASLASALTDAAGNASETDGPTEAQINGQTIQATYLHAKHNTAGSQILYGDPVNSASVEAIFNTVSPKAGEALTAVRGMHLDPVFGFGEPLLEPPDLSRPIFMEDPSLA